MTSPQSGAPGPSPADLAQIRTDYKRATLDEADARTDPFAQFARWMDEALHSGVHEPTAMTLATVGEDGTPDARIVLLKGADARGFVFYTNYESAKGRELTADGRVCLLFFWPELERQVRIRGTASQVEAALSDAYFASRPRGSRLGAIASPQSKPITRPELDALFAETDRQHPGESIPRPPHWGGYRVVPVSFEFWQGRASRMHDRLQYEKNEASPGGWSRQRLAP